MYRARPEKILSTASMLAVLLPLSPGVRASETVKVLVLRESSVGSSAQAQPHLDRLLGVAAKVKTLWRESYISMPYSMKFYLTLSDLSFIGFNMI